MSVLTNLTFERYLGDGSLNEYTFDFKITSLDQLAVVVLDNTGAEVQRLDGNDNVYIDSVEFDPVRGGGTVNLQDNLDADYVIFIFLAADDPVQLSKFRNKGQFNLPAIEQALDLIVCFLQRAKFLADRSLKLHDTDDLEEFDPTLPIGLAANTENIIPVFTGGGLAPIASWPTLTDLAAALAASEAAQDAQAAAEAAQAAAEQASDDAAAALTAAENAQAAAEAAADAAEATPNVLGSAAAPIAITGLINIPFTGVFWKNIFYISGNGGAVNVAGIAAGSTIGQELLLIVPAGANNVPIQASDANVNLNGDWSGIPNRALCLTWNGTAWFEMWRR